MLYLIVNRWLIKLFIDVKDSIMFIDSRNCLKGGFNLKNKLIGDENNILFYNDEDGNIKVEVILKNEDVWLNTEALAILFDVKRPAITKHINNIYNDQELEENSTCSKMEHMGNDGKQVYNTKYYNLDMIISIGFRVNSKKAIKFRTWANKIIKEYMIKGFTMDDERLKGNGGGNYWKELLARIKDIRSSEKVLYRQVLNLYATAVDYNPKDSKSIEFINEITSIECNMLYRDYLDYWMKEYFEINYKYSTAKRYKESFKNIKKELGNYKLYTCMREQNFNIVKYIEDILYIFNSLIDNK